ncbi:MAG: hypothetical protein NTV24_03355 [Candidatus Woesebacteria bacterium]|nr:hypothetical protein [Candidatus Woesebacteria bacterium]
MAFKKNLFNKSKDTSEMPTTELDVGKKLSEHDKTLDFLSKVTVTILFVMALTFVGLLFTYLAFVKSSFNEYSQSLERVNDNRILRIEQRIDKLEK